MMVPLQLLQLRLRLALVGLGLCTVAWAACPSTLCTRVDGNPPSCDTCAACDCCINVYYRLLKVVGSCTTDNLWDPRVYTSDAEYNVVQLLSQYQKNGIYDWTTFCKFGYQSARLACNFSSICKAGGTAAVTPHGWWKDARSPGERQEVAAADRASNTYPCSYHSQPCPKNRCADMSCPTVNTYLATGCYVACGCPKPADWPTTDCTDWSAQVCRDWDTDKCRTCFQSKACTTEPDDLTWWNLAFVDDPPCASTHLACLNPAIEGRRAP